MSEGHSLQYLTTIGYDLERPSRQIEREEAKRERKESAFSSFANRTLDIEADTVVTDPLTSSNTRQKYSSEDKKDSNKKKKKKKKTEAGEMSSE